MNARRTAAFSLGLLLTAGIGRGADLRPAVVTDLTGTLRIRQHIPCDGLVDRTVNVTGGRLELTPAEGLPTAGGGRYFSLTRSDLIFNGFSASGSCLGFSGTTTYGDIRVQLQRAVSFTALPTAAPGVFSITIPKTSFFIDYMTTVDGDLETGVKQPSEDPTGTIDLVTGTVAMHVVFATQARFRFGCVDLLGCIINETDDGTLTADIAGRIVFPDTDGDGVPDRADNCKYVANPDQTPVPTPVITPPPAVTIHSCADHNIGVARAADVCSGGPVTVTSNAPARFDLGANVVTWRAEDAMSHVATAAQTVTVVDTTPPAFTFVPPDITMTNCGPASLGTPAAVDDCAGIVTFSNNAPPIFYVGVTPVTWTARDVSGNTQTATQTVSVTDSVAPSATCVATSPTGNSFRVSAGDACGAPAIRLGGYALADGETIKINETGQPGVRLVNSVSDGDIRHFQVGRGEAVIVVTDASGNVSTATCPVR